MDILTRIERLEREIKISVNNARMMTSIGAHDLAKIYRKQAQEMNAELRELKRREAQA